MSRHIVKDLKQYGDGSSSLFSFFCNKKDNAEAHFTFYC